MEKKNRPVQQAANSDIRTSDITPTTSPVQVPKRTPKKHRARVYMLRTGVEDGQKMIFCATAVFHPGVIMRLSWSASLIFNWSVSTRKTRMVSAHTCATAFLPWRRSQGDPACEP
jgi:hypothetical protein